MQNFNDLQPSEKDHYRFDYGGMIEKEPQAIAHALSGKEATIALHDGHSKGLKTTFRGAGRGCAGQALSDKGLLLESYQREAVFDLLEPGLGSFPSWSQLCRAEILLNAKGLSFPVLPVYLNLSLGGVLSAGGLGLHSVTYGQTIDHVRTLTLVTGNGDQRELSAHQNDKLFRHALAGQGHLGFIEKASIGLVPHKPYTHFAQYTFDNLKEFLSSCSWLQSWTGEAQLQFIGSVGLNAPHTALYGEDVYEATDSILAPWQHLGMPQRTFTEKEHRLKYHYDIAFNTNMIRNTQGVLYSAYCFEYEQFCEHAHRLIELLTKNARAAKCVSRIPFYAIRQQVSAPYFPFSPRRPNSAPMLFGIGINWAVPLEDKEAWTHVKKVLDESLLHCLELGGKPYLGCWHEFTRQHLESFYPDGYLDLRELQSQYDPARVIAPGQLHFEAPS